MPYTKNIEKYANAAHDFLTQINRLDLQTMNLDQLADLCEAVKEVLSDVVKAQ